MRNYTKRKRRSKRRAAASADAALHRTQLGIQISPVAGAALLLASLFSDAHLHPHSIESRIHVEHLASDARRKVRS